MPAKLSIKETRFFMRNVRTRMPFKYGVATLTSVPILHRRVAALKPIIIDESDGDLDGTAGRVALPIPPAVGRTRLASKATSSTGSQASQTSRIRV